MTSEHGNNNFGDPIKYDKNFKGPLAKRSCTDVICLLIFVAFLAGWGFIGYFAIQNGDLNRLLVPSDSHGLRCGVDSQVVDKPFLLFFNLEKCIAPLVPINGCPTPQVCVDQCPKQMFLFDRNMCDSGSFEKTKSKLICSREVDMQTIRTCDDIEKLVSAESCARWYLPSDSILNRCISGIPPTICPLIPKRYVQRVTIAKNIDESSMKCDDKRRIGEEVLMEKLQVTDTMLSRFIGNIVAHLTNETNAQQEGQKIVEDIIATKFSIPLAFLIAMAACLILIAMMRWLACPLLWLSIFGVMGMLSFGIYYSSMKYQELKKNPIIPPPSTNLNALVQSYLAEKNTWLAFLIIASVVLAVILLVVLFLRKRIVIAIALVREGSKAVSSTMSTVFFPIFPWAFQVSIIGFAVIVGLYLASVGEQQNTIVGLANDTSCSCTGPAASYRDGMVCDPKIFQENCHNTNGRISQFLLKTGDNACTKASCHFNHIENPKYIIYFHLVNVVGFFWTVFFISAFGEMVLAATFATWYWTFNKSNVPFFTVTYGLGRTIRYHLGTLAFGSLIITICRLIRMILEYIDQKLKKYDNGFTRAILCCLKCFFWCLETFLKFLNRNAYIMCAIHGKNFCTSAKDAFNLLMRNVLRVVALDKVTDFLFFLSKILVTLGMGACAYFYYERYLTYKLNYVAVPVVVVMIGTYLIATVFFGVYTMAVNTLFLCFLEDCERNDGSAERPYFMSKNLMKILGKKNIVNRNHR